MLGEHFPEMVKIFMVKMLKFYDICSYLIVFFLLLVQCVLISSELAVEGKFMIII